ncbi:hypothetical protein EUTSA_v10004752mg [Eutrema salsugineum]|uniref:TF-B3 domain-containing protein n=1 Tax=Eutrema salsugineum TaxID=72664 RepID=V4ML08_EUTSA|nr:B3 domain-containing protein At5g25470 [Eutrema salsugineum]XP_024007651.1 B3 domain-containing protein At5g25470 [Eutrema salsugineum]ESQ32086.1 hypothetical protein EUTSA_v10004752mg [Eutrema salsugineum]
MPFKSFMDTLLENTSKPSFCKSLTLGESWKSKSMRIIPEEFVTSTPGAFEHRVVFSVRWGNSWQLWLKRDKKGLFMEEEDWNEFVDDNFLGPHDVLFVTHEDTMNLEVRIYKNYIHLMKEIISPPVEADPEAELLNPIPQNSHQETPASTSASASASASGARQGCVPVINPEQYLVNPKSPYFVKTLTKKIDVLYVKQPVIDKYGLKFGPHKSTMYYLIGKEKHEALTKIYCNGRNFCFSGWAAICRKYKLGEGDTVVCELERSGGVVTAVRVHFVNE